MRDGDQKSWRGSLYFVVLTYKLSTYLRPEQLFNEYTHFRTGPAFSGADDLVPRINNLDFTSGIHTHAVQAVSRQQTARRN